MKKAPKSEAMCPCGSGKVYAACCGPYIQGKARPESAVDLMRSRYTAYVLKEQNYLLRTWHATTRPGDLGLGDSPIKWMGLEVKAKEAGGKNDEQGTVEFEARCKINGKAEKLREKSRFVKEDGSWLYLDGELKEQAS